MVRVWGPNAGGVADPWAVARGGSHQGGPPPAQPSRAHTHLPAAKEQRPEKAPPASRLPPPAPPIETRRKLYKPRPLRPGRSGKRLQHLGGWTPPGTGTGVQQVGMLPLGAVGSLCSERGFVDQFKRLTFYSNPFSVKLSRELLKALQPREDQAFLLQRKPENHTGHQDDEITQDVQEEAYGSKSTPVNGPCSLYLDKGPPPAPDSFCSIPS